MGPVLGVKVLSQLIQKQRVFENPLNWLYELRAEGEGVANGQLTTLQQQTTC